LNGLAGCRLNLKMIDWVLVDKPKVIGVSQGFDGVRRKKREEHFDARDGKADGKSEGNSRHPVRTKKKNEKESQAWDGAAGGEKEALEVAEPKDKKQTLHMESQKGCSEKSISSEPDFILDLRRLAR